MSLGLSSFSAGQDRKNLSRVFVLLRNQRNVDGVGFRDPEGFGVTAEPS